MQVKEGEGKLHRQASLGEPLDLQANVSEITHKEANNHELPLIHAKMCCSLLVYCQDDWEPLC